MKTMKKVFFVILLMAAFLGMEAQESLNYTQKLDSVVGSKDFDWIRYKKVFDYDTDEAVILNDTYFWENNGWKLSEESVYQYATSDFQQLQSVIVMTANDTVLERRAYTTYEYNDLNQLILVMNYMAGDTSWVENSKYEYTYNADGLLDTCLYSTIRNGNWREGERSIYTYDENQQCIGLLAQRKGGWGPFANNWMDSYRYEFVYENGELACELYYVGGGWFGGGEMNLDSKVEYNFDANGNLVTKTASINNDGKDWIVRDTYENSYDLSVNASTVLGLEPFWQSFLKNGMGYAMGAPIPLKNLWKSCSVISSTLDTEFTLYCSGFAEVAEHQDSAPLKAYSFDGHLVVENPEPTDVVVYDLLGRVVARKNQVTTCEFNLTSGLYVVNNGNACMKVIVK